MRRYSLTSGDARRTVDLRDYADVITNAITTIMSGKDVTVVVKKDCYIVSPTPSRGESIRKGRLICKSTLCQYCVQRPVLFSGEDVEPKKEESNEPRT